MEGKLKRESKVYLKDMLVAIENIESYVVDYNKDEFSRDQKTIDAVLRNLEIIGEAVAQLPAEIKERYNTNLSKKCFWGMCTDIYYYRESDNENIYNLKICFSNQTRK